jgi:serine/threonine protein kinase
MDDNEVTLGLADSLTRRCPECGATYEWNQFHCSTDGTKLVACDTSGNTVHDRYLLISLLGEGGMGLVFKARDRRTDQVVAVKVLKFDKASAANFHRFKREGKLIFQLHHPNIVEVLEFSFAEGSEALIVMECLDGVSLAREIKSRGHLPVADAIGYAIQICNGVQYAHEQKIIHRDLKPSNLMLIKDSADFTVVKILDFGIAKSVDQNVTEETLTKSGELCGSPPYMSPEQAQGNALDMRSDVYSIGCILYEMLIGTQPLLGDTAFETLMKQITETPKTLTEAARGRKFPEELEAIAAKTLLKSPDDRYQTVAELRSDLLKVEQALASGKPVQSSVSTANVFVRNKVKIACVSSAILLVGILGFVSMQQQHPRTEAAKPDALSRDLNEVRLATLLAKNSKTDLSKTDRSEKDVDLPKWIAMRLKNDSGYSSIPTFSSSSPAMLKEIAQHKETTRLAFEDGDADSALGYISELQLHTLQLRRMAISDRGCAKLAQMQTIEELLLDKIPRAAQQPGKAGLDNLAKLRRLSSLAIINTDFSDSDLGFVSKLPELTKLDLAATHVTDRFLPNLAHLSQLSSLNLSRDLITDRGLLTLSNMPRIESLTLDDIPTVTDSGLIHLLKSHVKTLSLQNTQITDKSIDLLSKVKSLEELDLRRCKRISRQKLDQLRQKLPTCLIKA